MFLSRSLDEECDPCWAKLSVAKESNVKVISILMLKRLISISRTDPLTRRNILLNPKYPASMARDGTPRFDFGTDRDASNTI